MDTSHCKIFGRMNNNKNQQQSIKFKYALEVYIPACPEEYTFMYK